MENTLQVNDRVFVNKLHGAAERGDIVVFKGWNGEDTIKRVIGVGGDTVECCDAKKRITVNGTPLDESVLPLSGRLPLGRPVQETCPGQAVGDGRPPQRLRRLAQPRRSRGGGFISEDDVIGRPSRDLLAARRGADLHRARDFRQGQVEPLPVAVCGDWGVRLPVS